MNFTERWHTFFDRSAPNMILRFAVMFFGLALVAASVALTRASGLGTSPISCIPAVLSFTTAWTIGTWTFVVNVLFVLIQIILLRSDFNPIQFLQIAFSVPSQRFIDFFVPFCELIPMPNYGFELLLHHTGRIHDRLWHLPAGESLCSSRFLGEGIVP